MPDIENLNNIGSLSGFGRDYIESCTTSYRAESHLIFIDSNNFFGTLIKPAIYFDYLSLKLPLDNT